MADERLLSRFESEYLRLSACLGEWPALESHQAALTQRKENELVVMEIETCCVVTPTLVDRAMAIRAALMAAGIPADGHTAGALITLGGNIRMELDHLPEQTSGRTI